jgi:hypothetical protein
MLQEAQRLWQEKVAMPVDTIDLATYVSANWSEIDDIEPTEVNLNAEDVCIQLFPLPPRKNSDSF